MSTELVSVETVRAEGSWLFTATDDRGEQQEVLLVPCEDGVEAWVNRCTHQQQRLDTGRGAAIRDGQIVCPRHGSMFDACSGDCDNGPAADTRLVDVEVAVEDGTAYLTDEDYEFSHEGGADAGSGTDGDEEDDDDDLPGSTSHISF